MQKLHENSHISTVFIFNIVAPFWVFLRTSLQGCHMAVSSSLGTSLKTFGPDMFITLRSTVVLVKFHLDLYSFFILLLFPSSGPARTNCNNLLSWILSISRSAGWPFPAESVPARPFHQPGSMIPCDSETSTQLHPKIKGSQPTAVQC